MKIKRIPSNLSVEQVLKVNIVKDYFGEVNNKEKNLVRRITLFFLENRRKVRPGEFTVEEADIIENIRENMKDELYAGSFGTLNESTYLQKVPLA